MMLRFIHTHKMFFFKNTAPTEIYTLSLHDALPICVQAAHRARARQQAAIALGPAARGDLSAQSGHLRRPRDRIPGDRKSTRLNSSHVAISYAVFCLKKKKIKRT